MKIELKKDKNLSENISRINLFKEKCLKNELKLTDENFKYVDNIGIVVTYPNIVKYLNVKHTIDKEGLVKVDLSDIINSRGGFGYVYESEYYLIVHKYFRREFSDNNTYSPNFVRKFWALIDEPFESFIAIDFNRVCLKLDLTDDLDIHYGAVFNKNIIQIPNGLVKLMPNEKEKINKGNIYSLDIKWKTQNGNRVFEAEEFRTTDIKLKVDDIEYFPVRYIHSVFNNEHKCFDHFDGAIHLYNKDEYLRRRDSDLNYNYKNYNQIKPKSVKLFKFNGKINIKIWATFISQFLKNNFLLFEYLKN